LSEAIRNIRVLRCVSGICPNHLLLITSKRKDTGVLWCKTAFLR